MKAVEQKHNNTVDDAETGESAGGLCYAATVLVSKMRTKML